jgi:zinc protease
VALLPKKTRGNTVVLRLTLRYGTPQTLVGLTKAAEFLPAMMTRGTKQLTRQQLQDQLDQNLATLSSSGQAGEATFVIQTKRDKLPTVLGLLQQVLREPTLPASELELLRQQSRSDLEQSQTDPQSLAVRLVQRTLSPYPQGDVRYIPTLPEELKLLQDLDIAAVRRLHNDFLGSQAGQLVVVGDFDAEPTFELLESLLHGWRSKHPYERIGRRGDQEIKADLVKIETPDKANAFYFAGHVLPISDSHPDYPALVMANYVFGAGALSSRLGDRVRQQEGLSYGVGSVFRANSLDERASISMYAITNPANMDRVVQAIREELVKLLKEGVTEQELQRAQQGYLQGQEVSRTEDPHLARILEDTLYASRTMAHYADLETAVRKLTPEEVVAALRRHVSTDRIFTAVAGDFAAAAKAAAETSGGK